MNNLKLEWYDAVTDSFPGFSAKMEELLPNAWPLLDEFAVAFVETLYMLLLTVVIAGVIGLIVGIMMTLTGPKGLLPHRGFYKALDTLINIFRSIPFVILLALLVNFTRIVAGTSIGATAASVPIIVGTIPFFARQVEIALLEVDPGVIEAAEAMGSSPLDIIFRVYLREGLPALLRVSASTVINVIGLTAMAGAVGGGGLGTVAIARGYQRSRMDVIVVATVLILLIVFVSQATFNLLIKMTDHKK
ncbi:ABC transporter permease [Facklamia sp. DSM 111018]|uniref:ABC transporter permease n=1 Tax=Facklamia lactis TaxID=2749967 RepID=A0ABS0LSI7_9LACT|nr:ABC transporter permease [Facklamia lactis]MBG9987127.1 ABC transporter permease [Facklamia lactis]